MARRQQSASRPPFAYRIRAVVCATAGNRSEERGNAPESVLLPACKNLLPDKWLPALLPWLFLIDSLMCSSGSHVPRPVPTVDKQRNINEVSISGSRSADLGWWELKGHIASIVPTSGAGKESPAT